MKNLLKNLDNSNIKPLLDVLLEMNDGFDLYHLQMPSESYPILINTFEPQEDSIEVNIHELTNILLAYYRNRKGDTHIYVCKDNGDIEIVDSGCEDFEDFKNIEPESVIECQGITFKFHYD
jgi:hypothetical protein